jgi:hypothetical protein
MKYSIFAILSFLIVPAVAMAGGSQGFVPLVGIPGLDSANTPTFDDYIDALYALAISVAALIAVIQIVIGGAQYMMDDLITSKSAAKERIKNALIGLLIIIAAALILTTINSDLTRLDINAPAIDVNNGNGSTPDPVDAFAALCAEAVANGGACSNESCSNITAFRGVMDMTGDSCREVCAAIEGIFRTPPYRNAQPVCDYDTSRLATLQAEQLQGYADANCPATATSCRAELSTTYCEGILDGNLSGCRTQCLDQRNGVAFDETSWACVFANGQTTTPGNITVNPNTNYTLQQNADEIAAGDPVRTIEIVGTNSVNGFVEVRFTDTGEVSQLSCAYIQPSVCN